MEPTRSQFNQRLTFTFLGLSLKLVVHLAHGRVVIAQRLAFLSSWHFAFPKTRPGTIFFVTGSRFGVPIPRSSQQSAKTTLTDIALPERGQVGPATWFLGVHFGLYILKIL